MTPLLPHDFPKGVSEELARLHGILLQSEDKDMKEWAKSKIEGFYEPFLKPVIVAEKECGDEILNPEDIEKPWIPLLIRRRK